MGPKIEYSVYEFVTASETFIFAKFCSNFVTTNLLWKTLKLQTGKNLKHWDKQKKIRWTPTRLKT